MRVKILLPMLILLLALAAPLTMLPAHAVTYPVQVTGPNGNCNNPVPCLFPDIIGVNSGAASGSTFGVDSKGNFIALVACSNFSNDGCASHGGTLVWSNDKGNTWVSCDTLQNGCTSEQTTHAMQNTGSTCIHAGAIFVSGTTVDVGYQQTASNAQANFYVDRFIISYSGNAITDIANTGGETVATATDQTTSGFACVQQILATPNGGADPEIMVFAVEENSGPLYMFRTHVTATGFSNLAGTASAISSTIVSQNDGSNSCSQFMPGTGDIWNFDVYDRTGGTVFVNTFPFSGGNWGAVTSQSQGGNKGVPLLTKSTACAADPVDNAIFWSWFNCTKQAGTICTTGAPGATDTCRWVMWEVTASSGTPTQLASLNDHTNGAGGNPSSCHQTQNNSNVGGEGTLTYVKGQLFMTGVDDNMFGSGCPTEGGSDQTKCQQLFLAKFSATSLTWGSISQYPNNPVNIMGGAAFTNSAGDFQFIYDFCNNYLGAGNANDGNCGAANGNSLQYDPIFAPPPPNPAGKVSVNASALVGPMLIMFMFIGLLPIVHTMAVSRRLPEGEKVDTKPLKAGLALVIVGGLALLIIIAAGGG